MVTRLMSSTQCLVSSKWCHNMCHNMCQLLMALLMIRSQLETCIMIIVIMRRLWLNRSRPHNVWNVNFYDYWRPIRAYACTIYICVGKGVWATEICELLSILCYCVISTLDLVHTLVDERRGCVIVISAALVTSDESTRHEINVLMKDWRQLIKIYDHTSNTYSWSLFSWVVNTVFTVLLGERRHNSALLMIMLIHSLHLPSPLSSL